MNSTQNKTDTNEYINKENFGLQFKKAIDSCPGMSQNKLAIKLGMSKTTINGYANGKNIPPLDLLFQIADILDKPIDFFFDDPGYYNGRSKGDYARMAIELLTTKEASLEARDNDVALIIKEPFLCDFLRSWNQYRELVVTVPSTEENFNTWTNEALRELDSEKYGERE